ncbi:hypothetical protein V8F20_004001 [Naviculisporaceae sp. PSN 640]
MPELWRKPAELRLRRAAGKELETVSPAEAVDSDTTPNHKYEQNPSPSADQRRRDDDESSKEGSHIVCNQVSALVEPNTGYNLILDHSGLTPEQNARLRQLFEDYTTALYLHPHNRKLRPGSHADIRYNPKSFQVVPGVPTSPVPEPGAQNPGVKAETQSVDSPTDGTPSQAPSSDGSESDTSDTTFLDEWKQNVIETAVKAAYTWLQLRFELSHPDSARIQEVDAGCEPSDADPGASPRHDHSGSRSNSIEQHPAGCGSNHGGNSTKRKTIDRRDDDENDEERPLPSRSRVSKGDAAEMLRFACPYYKYNKAKYGRRKGCLGGWPDVHRVKEHLYRTHRQPRFTCARCSDPFQNEKTQQEHLRKDPPCVVVPFKPLEGFDAGQEALLKSRKKAITGLSEAERWKAVFRILFPHVEDCNIPSPLWDCNEELPPASSSDWKGKEYILKEAPVRLRSKLAQELDQDLDKVKGDLKEKAIGIMTSILAELFEECDQRTQAAEASGSSLSTHTALLPTEQTTPQQAHDHRGIALEAEAQAGRPPCGNMILQNTDEHAGVGPEVEEEPQIELRTGGQAEAGVGVHLRFGHSNRLQSKEGVPLEPIIRSLETQPVNHGNVEIDAGVTAFGFSGGPASQEIQDPDFEAMLEDFVSYEGIDWGAFPIPNSLSEGSLITGALNQPQPHGDGDDAGGDKRLSDSGYESSSSNTGIRAGTLVINRIQE